MGFTKQWRSAAVIAGLAIGAVSQTSCRIEPPPPTVVDLSDAAVDTVVIVNDDRTTIVAVASDRGRQAILSDTTPFVEVVGVSGESVRFGSTGDGPGEFRFPSGIAWSGDTLLVWDPTHGRLTLFDRKGALLDVRTVPGVRGKIFPRLLRNGYGPAGRITATSEGVVVAVYGGAVQAPYGLWTIALTRIPLEGDADTLPIVFPSVESLRALNDSAFDLVAIPLWASCGAAGLSTWEPIGEVLRRYRVSGREGRSDSVGAERVALTDDVVRINLRHQLDEMLRGRRTEPAEYDQMLEAMLGQSRRAPQIFPPTSPAFLSMHCDERGEVWLQHFSLADAGSGMGRTWTLVDLSGSVRAVRLPPNLRVHQIEEGWIWGVRVGEEGQLFLVKLELPRS